MKHLGILMPCLTSLLLSTTLAHAEPILQCRNQAAEYAGEENSPGIDGKTANKPVIFAWVADCFKVADQLAKATGVIILAPDVVSKPTPTDRTWKCVSPTKYTSAPCLARCCYAKNPK